MENGKFTKMENGKFTSRLWNVEQSCSISPSKHRHQRTPETLEKGIFGHFLVCVLSIKVSVGISVGHLFIPVPTMYLVI
jgi:hypothetical protein